MSEGAKIDDGLLLMSERQYHEGVADNWGICPDCGCYQDEFYEPDRRNGKCYSCGKMNCVGFEWALVSGKIEFTEDEDDED